MIKYREAYFYLLYVNIVNQHEADSRYKKELTMRKIVLFNFIVFSVLMIAVLLAGDHNELIKLTLGCIFITGTLAGILVCYEFLRFSRTGKSILIDA
tara:strand:- start:278 stop:568 length:291 start_codon:yes stop_codon:yes gene_type:complete